MLKLNDLSRNETLTDSRMSQVTGGTSDFERLSALIDFSSDIASTVGSVSQGIGLRLGQSNDGNVVNTQIIQGGNGVIYAPVRQEQTQANYLDLLKLGNSLVS